MNSFLLNEYNNFWNLDKIIREEIENLNKEQFSKKLYYEEYNSIYNFVLEKYESNSIETSQKDFLFDIIVELFLGCKYQLKISTQIYDKFLRKVYEKKYYDILLKYYKDYDYLNKDDNLVKILVSYIKPSFLFKSDILTPIHLGRAVEKDSSKDGILSNEDIKWLHYNCIRDDDFDDNISYINRRVGLFTGTYWAWKNYEKLGNPRYFGSFGYRRLLFPHCLNRISDYDLILPAKKTINKTIKADIIYYHGNLFYEKMIKIMSELYPNELDDVIKHFNSNESYFAEIYIMKKSLFFEFCEWAYKILDYILINYPVSILNEGKKGLTVEKSMSQFLSVNNQNIDLQYDVRDIAFIFERLTGYYLFKLKNNKNIKYREIELFEPYFKLLVANNKMILNKMRYNVRKDLKNA